MNPVTLARLKRGRRESWTDRVMRGVCVLFAVSTIPILFGIVGILFYQSITFFQAVSIIDFLTDTQWTPFAFYQHFGIFPLVAGTLLISVIALAVAVPLGLLTAIYLSEYAPDRVRKIIKPTLEILAGIPTVVLGFFALATITPWLRSWIPGVNVFNALSAGLATGFMILPIIATLSEDAMLRVPITLREGAYALGARQHVTALRVVIPASLSGIVAAIILGLSRALGETMIVAMAGGSTPNLTWDPRQSVQAMTGFIAQAAIGEEPFGSLGYNSMFAVGIVLIVMVLIANIFALYFQRRFKERY